MTAFISKGLSDKLDNPSMKLCLETLIENQRDNQKYIEFNFSKEVYIFSKTNQKRQYMI